MTGRRLRMRGTEGRSPRFMTSASLFALTLLIIILSACASDDMDDWSESVEPTELHVVENPSAPPEYPPTQHVILTRDDKSNRSVRYAGVMVYYHWTINGQPDSFEILPPIEWPSTLTLKSNHTLVLDLGTAITPALVQLRLYRELGSDGIPTGVPVLLSCSNLEARSEQCELRAFLLLPTARVITPIKQLCSSR